MPFGLSGRKKIGPLTVHVGKKGVTSVGVRTGRATWTAWSRTRRSGLSSVDMPGPVSWRPKATRRTR